MAFIIRKTIAETFLERVKNFPELIGFQFKPTHADMGPVGEWKKVSFKEFYQVCRLISYGIIGLGIKNGDRAVILSNSRFEWSLVDMAILGAGAIPVPIYASSTTADVLYILNQTESRIAFVEDSKQLEKLLQKRREDPNCLPFLEKVIVFEPAAMTLAHRYPESMKYLLTLQALKELGRREEVKKPNQFDETLRSLKSDDLMTICYTSGTLGVPKGAMLTHANLMSFLEDCVKVFGKSIHPEKEVILSFLPFSHIFGRVESLAVYAFGWICVYTESLDQLLSNLAEIQPTLLFAVPRFFEKIFNRILNELEAGPASRKKVFDFGFKVGEKYYRQIWGKKNPSVRDRLEYELAKKFIFKRIRERFGERFRFAICGGAPLSKKIGEFFQIIGIRIMEGYGLTETCSAISVNLLEDTRFGTVGKPLPEVTVKIAEDGEILVKSKKVFNGYLKMPEETQQVLQDGWFYTGDIGFLDSDGFLHITDRKKDFIVTSGGETIAPQKIENRAKSQKLIQQFVVYGDKHHYLTVLIGLDRNQTIRFANENRILFSEYEELIKNPKIISWVQKMIDEINEDLASPETIKKFVILPNEFSVEGGELTPSLKIRRSSIYKKYQSQLESLYADTVRVPIDSH